MQLNQIQLKNLRNKLIQIIIVYLLYLIVISFLYYKNLHVSGGDLVIILFSNIFLIIYTIVIGAFTFSKTFKQKTGFIIGLLICYVTQIIYLNYI